MRISFLCETILGENILQIIQGLVVTALIFGQFSSANIGVDVSSAVTEAQWKCLQEPGGQGPISRAGARIFRNVGEKTVLLYYFVLFRYFFPSPVTNFTHRVDNHLQ